MSVFITLLHRGNIWMADSMGRQLRANLRRGVGNPALFGLGVYFAFREAERVVGASVANDDGVNFSIVDSSTAAHCQDALLAYVLISGSDCPIFPSRADPPHFVANQHNRRDLMENLRVSAKWKSGSL